MFVTGGASFIGSTLTHVLLDRGDEVVGIDNLNDYYDVRLKQARLDRLRPRKGFIFQKLDIVERKPMGELFKAGKFDTHFIEKMQGEDNARHAEPQHRSPTAR